MPKISVIVPVYNSEKYIRRCVDSILSQTYLDFELLIINDGSTDRTREICDEYAVKDCRVRVFHKNNGGVSYARNIGLDNAKGEWVTFVDSDDWVSNSYLYNLLSHIDSVDLVISYAEIVYSTGKRRKENYGSKIITDKYDVLFVENDLNWHTSPWSKLFKTNLCENLRFIEGMHIGEDLAFLYTYMLNCDKVYVSSDTDYFYYVENQDSLTKRVNHLNEELLSYHNVNQVIGKLIKSKGITSPKALSKLGWITAYYVRRVLNSLYYDGEKRTLSSRIKYIKTLDLEKYVKYIEISSYKERIYLYMLKFRLFVLYDLIRVFIGWSKR